MFRIKLGFWGRFWGKFGGFLREKFGILGEFLGGNSGILGSILWKFSGMSLGIFLGIKLRIFYKIDDCGENFGGKLGENFQENLGILDQTLGGFGEKFYGKNFGFWGKF